MWRIEIIKKLYMEYFMQYYRIWSWENIYLYACSKSTVAPDKCYVKLIMTDCICLIYEKWYQARHRVKNHLVTKKKCDFEYRSTRIIRNKGLLLKKIVPILLTKKPLSLQSKRRTVIVLVVANVVCVMVCGWGFRTFCLKWLTTCFLKRLWLSVSFWIRPFWP